MKFAELLRDAKEMERYRSCNGGSYHSVFVISCTREQSTDLLNMISEFGVLWMGGTAPSENHRIGEAYVFYVNDKTSNDIRIRYFSYFRELDATYGPIFDFNDVFVDLDFNEGIDVLSVL